MSNVLLVAEHAAGKVRKATLSALTAARQLAARTGGQVSAVVVGQGVGPVAAELAGYGLPVACADAPALAHPLSELHGKVIADAAQAAGASWVVGAATAQGKDLLPCVAVRLQAGCATDVMAVLGEGAEVVLRRPMWAGNALAEVEIRTARKVISVRATEFAAAEKAAAPGPVTALAPAAAAARTSFVALELAQSARPELTEARAVVSGGRGTAGDFKPIEGLADDLGAAVGASRAAVDAGWAPNDLQVGQTGKVVAPELYVAAGISGALQHIAGMKGAKTIIAINNDPDAAIFQVADYGLVADLFEAIPAIREKLANERKGK